jgi:hypothetical protein
MSRVVSRGAAAVYASALLTLNHATLPLSEVVSAMEIVVCP